MALTVGERLGRYEIRGALGAGGMGEVYRARDEVLERDVAVKVLPEEVAADPERRSRFEREAKTVARLSHPNILAIHDFGREDEVAFAVTELLEGESLRQRIGRAPVDWRTAVRICGAMADGLAAAHREGVIHRDLKPANVFITSDDQIKILDFGLARVVAPPSADGTTWAGEDTRTHQGTVVGTLGYMSPEQLKGDEVGPSTDIFSLGCVLYELLSGRRAFQRDSAVETMAAILHEEPPSIQDVGIVVDAELTAIVDRCLEKRPEQRYQSASDLAFALRSLLSGSGSGSGSGRWHRSSVPRTRLTRLRRWTLSIAVILCVGAVVVGLWLGIGGKRFPDDVEGDAFDPGRVVVAVFDNRTGDETLDTLGELASDWIQNSLQDIDGLTVATNPYGAGGRGQQPPSGGAGVDPHRHLAEVTRSALVVAGAYYSRVDRLEFQTRILDPWRGDVLVAFDPVAGPRGDPSEAIGSVRQKIAGALAAHFDAVIELGTERPVSLEAYREYRDGMEIWGSDYPAATAHLERALETVPNFHLARGMLCWAYKNQGRYADAEAEIQRLEQDAGGRGHARACRAALEGRWLDLLAVNREHVQQSPGVLWLKVDLGANAIKVNRPREAVDVLETIPFDWISSESVHAVVPFTFLAAGYHLLGEYEAQLRVARQGFHHFPDQVVLIGHQTDALAALCRLDEIEQLIDRCLAIPVGVGDAGVTLRITAEELRAHGHRDQSIELANRLVARYSNRSGGGSRWHKVHLARALIVAERWQEAQTILEELAGQHPEVLANHGWLGVLAARTGDRVEAEHISDELRAVERPYLNGEHTYWRACIAAHLGDDEVALDLLRDAFSQGRPFGIGIHRSLALEPLWDDREFRELIAPKG